MTDQIPDEGYGSWAQWCERADKHDGANVTIDSELPPADDPWLALHIRWLQTIEPVINPRDLPPETLVRLENKFR